MIIDEYGSLYGQHSRWGVYNKQGISPTLVSAMGEGGGYIPMVVNELEGLNTMPDGTCRTIKSQYGNTSSANFEYSSTFGATGVIETVKIKQATSQGYIECEVGGVADLSFPESKTRRGRVQEKGQVSLTLMAGEQDICRIENVYDFYNNNLKSDGVCGTLTSAGSHNGSGTFGIIEPQYRIRKLTPLECWSLMNFSEEDFLSAKLGSSEVAKEILETYPHLGKRAFTEIERLEKMSNTQLYKQAGNSIVKNVLVAILGQMIPGKEEVYRKLETR